jgi:hypothetical protein
VAEVKIALLISSTWEGNSLSTVLIVGLKRSGTSVLFPPWLAGSFGWKETRKSLKMVPLLFRRLFIKLWECWKTLMVWVLGKGSVLES